MSDRPTARLLTAMEPTVVVKLGSNLLTDANGHLDEQYVHLMAQQISAVRRAGWRVIVVSSGAVAAGYALVGDDEMPTALGARQALAAIGQAEVVQRWQQALQSESLLAAQVLLTSDDFQHRERYLNLTASLRELLARGVVPIVNENDVVAVDELTLGDNDQLSAALAGQLAAQQLVILTDIDGLYDADPRSSPSAQRIAHIPHVDDASLALAGGAGALGRGGMRSKLLAARTASRSGVATVIADGRAADVLVRIIANPADPGLGTAVPAERSEGLTARRRWLATRQPRGSLVVDAGAARALLEDGRSLLAVGIRASDGEFGRGDTVAVLDPDGHEIARGLAAWSAQQVTMYLAAELTDEAVSLLPKAVIHRDNLLSEIVEKYDD